MHHEGIDRSLKILDQHAQNTIAEDHLTFEDQTFGPDFSPLGLLIAQKNHSCRVICESAGTQAKDAAEMMAITKRFQEGETIK